MSLNFCKETGKRRGIGEIGGVTSYKKAESTRLPLSTDEEKLSKLRKTRERLNSGMRARHTKKYKAESSITLVTITWHGKG